MALDPISLVFGAFSLVSGFLGQQQQASAAAANEQSRADAAKRNAQIESRNKVINDQEAEQQDKQLQRSQQQSRSQEVLGTFENGGGFGSGLDIISQNDVTRRLDRENLAYKYALKSQGIDIQIGELDYQADQANRNAKDASSAGFIGGLGTLATGATSLYSKTKTGFN